MFSLEMLQIINYVYGRLNSSHVMFICHWSLFFFPRLSGHTPAVPGGDVHPERYPRGVLPGRDQQCLPMVSGSCWPTGHPLYRVARRLSGLHTRAQASGQHHAVTFPLPHCLQHPGPEHGAGLWQGRRVPPKVRLSLKPVRCYHFVFTCR